MSSVVEHTTDLNGGERMLRGTYKNRMVLGGRRERSEARWGGAHEPIILGAVLIGRYWVEEEGGWEWWSWV